jgi:FMN-dependent NADH-azoreductase
VTTFLHISTSPRGDGSESIALAASFLTGLTDTQPEVKVQHWDLWDGTLPAFGRDYAAAKMTTNVPHRTHPTRPLTCPDAAEARRWGGI